MNEELIDFIVSQLKIYTNNDAIDYMLKSRKTWVEDKTLEKCSYLEPKFEVFKRIDNAFEKDIYLKFTINKIYNNQLELDEWIVKDWGGISTHKNFHTLNKSKEQKKFDRISSWSKLLSFENIEEDVIYDSRVIYSLNWLIYKYNKLNNKEEKYLFQPDGRNKRLSLLPVNSIIYFEHASSLQEELKGDKIYNNLFTEKNKCYDYAKELIKIVNNLLFKDINYNLLSLNIDTSKYPFFTEMLLFELADKRIFDDIKESININIKA